MTKITHFFYNYSSLGLCFLLITLIFHNGQAQINYPLVIKNAQNMHFLGAHIYYLKDNNGKLKIEDILQPSTQGRFTPHKKKTFSRQAMQASFWLKFTITNQTYENLWLKIGDAFTSWSLSFYAPDSTGEYTYPPVLLGTLHPQKNKLFPSNYYCVPLAKPHETTPKTFYLRLSGSKKVSGNFVKIHTLQAGTQVALTKDVKIYDYLVAVFVGLVIAMFAYNLFLLYATRFKIYLIYLLYLVCILIAVPFHNGHPLFYGSWWWEYYFVWISTLYFCISWFSTNYLGLAHYAPKYYYWIGILTLVYVIVFPCLNLLHWVDFVTLINAFQAMALVYYFSLLMSGLYVWRKGYKNARFYVLGWFFLISSVFVFVLAINGILPLNLFTYHCMYLGFGLEALMFSLALGDRLNTLKKEKEQAQAKNLFLIKEQNTLLEQKVNEKTQKLQEAYEAIQASHEELLQSQEEIAAQKDALSEQNDMLSRYRQRIDKSFQAACQIQQATLPAQVTIEQVFSESFIVYHPKDIVAGDFYWMETTNNKTIFVAGDCVGHGISGAFITIIMHILLTKIVRVEKITSPIEILHQLQQNIENLSSRDALAQYIAMDAAVICLEPTAGSLQKLTFAGAKQNLLYWDASRQVFQNIKGARKSIGGIPMPNRSFEEHELELSKGSKVYVGSDGLEDQSNRERKRFGRKRIEKILTESIHLSLNQQGKILEQAFNKHKQSTDQRDDILWVGLKL